MRKIMILAVCFIFSVATLSLAADLKKVDNPTIEMLQGKWEGKFTRTTSKNNMSGEFTMNFKGNKAWVVRGATYTDAATRWVVTIDKIEKGKIYMSNQGSDFEVELIGNSKGGYLMEGNYTGRKAGHAKSANSDIKLQKVSATFDEKEIEAAGKGSE